MKDPRASTTIRKHVCTVPLQPSRAASVVWCIFRNCLLILFFQINSRVRCWYETDGRTAPRTPLLIRSAEVRGECRYENGNNNNVDMMVAMTSCLIGWDIYRSILFGVPLRSLENAKKLWRNKYVTAHPKMRWQLLVALALKHKVLVIKTNYSPWIGTFTGMCTEKQVILIFKERIHKIKRARFRPLQYVYQNQLQSEHLLMSIFPRNKKYYQSLIQLMHQ